MAKKMMKLSELTRYQPSDEESASVAAMGAVFLMSSDGRDWYLSQQDFSADTIKIVYDARGVISSVTDDVSTLNPEGMSVAEVASLPEGFALNGEWSFVGGSIEPRIYTAVELMARAETEKQDRLAECQEHIGPLQDAVDLGDASEADITSLKLWKAYRVAVYRVDITSSNIIWPERPDVA